MKERTTTDRRSWLPMERETQSQVPPRAVYRNAESIFHENQTGTGQRTSGKQLLSPRTLGETVSQADNGYVKARPPLRLQSPHPPLPNKKAPPPGDQRSSPASGAFRVTGGTASYSGRPVLNHSAAMLLTHRGRVGLGSI